ncbi:MAG: CapA family protein [Armatimonadota bacterium]|nr:CapA family protein [Armatimonadota bacterium]MDR7427832.1 CapA family protein [Armatimonadota bacterium]MDR7463539.1 CapA family protein [Armatimonadota bacterium]MDR7470604.1 CapA family protein [Armatimonadota bacterium]MDR7473879.1 CapA family protein [Armatimonadota bacterium]
MRLAATGDVMLGRNAGAVLRRRPPEYVWGDTLHLLRQADALIVNLECVIAGEESGSPWPRKVFHFKAPPQAVAALQAAGVSAVTLANNHTLDFGPAALAEMLDLLAAAGLPAAGAGRTAEEARRVVSLTVRGLRLALVSWTDNEPGWEAGPEKPGVFYAPVDLEDPRATALLQTVRAARAGHDVVVVAAHWGPNMVPEPLPAHPPFARALADAGADLVLGTSAHVVQGIELYRPLGRPERVAVICYDLGDYVDDYAVDPVLRNDLSLLFLFDVNSAGVRRVELHPVLIDGWRCQVNRARGTEAEAVLETMTQRCRKLGTALQRTAPLVAAVEAA